MSGMVDSNVGDLEKGMYWVTDIFDKRPAVELSRDSGRVIADRQVYAPPSERRAPRYVAIDAKEYVPLHFRIRADRYRRLDRSKTLGIAPDAKYTERLKQFTTEHLGKERRDDRRWRSRERPQNTLRDRRR